MAVEVGGDDADEINVILYVVETLSFAPRVVCDYGVVNSSTEHLQKSSGSRINYPGFSLIMLGHVTNRQSRAEPALRRILHPYRRFCRTMRF
jgi:hypothetical protein